MPVTPRDLIDWFLLNLSDEQMGFPLSVYDSEEDEVFSLQDIDLITVDHDLEQVLDPGSVALVIKTAQL